MMPDPREKYCPAPAVPLEDRSWPGRTLTQAPIWCAVDLRDGNQALIDPMTPERKRRLFDLLVEIGFREIEVGFPSASRDDHDFLRHLIESGAIPDSVTIQVLVPARRELIEKTFQALSGVKRAIVHLYNSTSTLQRRVVFGMDREGIIALARDGASWVRDGATALSREGSDIRFQYSPESFSGTEPDFAVAICEAVMEVWEPTPERRVILNLPNTVEMATPNHHADQIEWFLKHVKGRERVILSLHAHNDRGTAVAATELGLLAGADRVEGTLFGNGERTGNVDLVTVAMNLYCQGISTGLDFSRIRKIVETVEEINGIPVHPRHPYGGELVFTAFSGSHQDAIRKGLKARQGSGRWEVPYLPIDPADLGREYEPVIRINSQSGKGGVAHILEERFGYKLPRAWVEEFARQVQKLADDQARELHAEEIGAAFTRSYMPPEGPFALMEYATMPGGEVTSLERRQLRGKVMRQGVACEISGAGNGPVSAFADAIQRSFGISVEVLEFEQHAVTRGTRAEAVTYLTSSVAGGAPIHTLGRDVDTTSSSLQAIIAALNKAAGTPSGG
ncbi:MAG: 2-isopropylmalate synthase [Magnetococcales bacterium]|nr:2-isopropylmalate synthase [Magnetococcales bacterium]MBF0157291.1 2-isopropylmalate synthase [Magnetococcales bacterium]